MTSAGAGTLDEAYERLHATGPEFDGFLSNHGPMAAEAMVRRGHSDRVDPWLDRYMRRLEDFPRGTSPIGSDWREALGDLRRVADWTAYFRAEIGERPWREVLNTWWPRLLPGVVAAATHGVIRVGHAVRALLADGDDPAHLAELAHGLAYWAARWQTVPGGHSGASAAAAASRARVTTPLDALAAVPRITGQAGGIGDRLARLGALPAWPAAVAGLSVPAAPEQIRTVLAELVDAATVRYLLYGHGNGVMLVHSATAPSAVLRTLPALDDDLWAASLSASWVASSALTAVYAPAEPAPRAHLPQPPDGQSPEETAQEVFARAVDHGDAHVIKFADTAVDVFARTGNPDAIAAALRAAELIEP
jgi:questin oxidase-like protein